MYCTRTLLRRLEKERTPAQKRRVIGCDNHLVNKHNRNSFSLSSLTIHIMSNREAVTQRSAMVARVGSALEGIDVHIIDNVKSVLAGIINFEQHGGRQTLMDLLNVDRRYGTGEKTALMGLAIALEEYMKNFLVLDKVESSNFFCDARLPRSLLEEWGLGAYQSRTSQ